VLQTVLPALLRAPSPSRVVLDGGTHNPHAPTVEFLKLAFLPLLHDMGAVVDLSLERHGFYPAGGGRIAATIEPATSWRPLELTRRGEIVSREAVATVAGLSGEIAKRELRVVVETLGWNSDSLRIVQLDPVSGPGNFVTITLRSEHVTEVFSSIGTRGVSAEAVAGQAIEQVRDYLRAGVPVGRFLADQIMLPLALAGGGRFLTRPLTNHATTNASVIAEFLSVPIIVTDAGGKNQCVEIGI